MLRVSLTMHALYFVLPFTLMVMSPLAFAAKKVLCTITLNSDDEGKVFRRHLPTSEWEPPIELVDQRNPQWFQDACRRDTRCDVVIISGHFAREAFSAGTEPEHISRAAFLKVEDMERAACSGACPGIFSHPKEIYMFGCNTLNVNSTNYTFTVNEHEFNRSRMRRIFAGVPVVYGFASTAPLGPRAAVALNGYFRSAVSGEIGSGRMNHRLLSQLAGVSMTAVNGMRSSDSDFPYHQQVCQFYDERLPMPQKNRLAAEILNRDFSQVALFFDHLEKYVHSLSAADRETIAAAPEARRVFMVNARRTSSVELRLRLTKVAESLGWMSREEYQVETLRMVQELFDANAIDYASLALLCPLNETGEFDSLVADFELPVTDVAKAGVLACLGHGRARAAMIEALASSNIDSVRVAQNYFRLRPLRDAADMRALARRILEGGNPEAQIRALETLARFRIDDRDSLEALLQVFADTRNPGTQQAIAKVFLFADFASVDKAEFARVIRARRLRSVGGSDATDFLLHKLE